MLVKPLAKLGNSKCIPLDKTLLSLLGVEPNGSVKITFEGKKMIVEPMSAKEYHEYVLAASEQVAVNHAKTLEKLAK